MSILKHHTRTIDLLVLADITSDALTDSVQ